MRDAIGPSIKIYIKRMVKQEVKPDKFEKRVIVSIIFMYNHVHVMDNSNLVCVTVFFILLQSMRSMIIYCNSIGGIREYSNAAVRFWVHPTIICAFPCVMGQRLRSTLYSDHETLWARLLKIIDIDFIISCSFAQLLAISCADV